MTTYKELLQQRDALEQKIQELRRSELQDAVEKVRVIVAEYQLTQDDVFAKRRTSATGTTVEPRYRDPATGATWTGRGQAPRWIRDKNRDDFLIS